MAYALIANGSVVTYPYSIDDFRKAQLERTDGSVSLPLDPTLEQLAEVGIYPVTVEAATVPVGHKVDGYTVVFDTDKWVQRWNVVPFEIEEYRAARLAEVRAKQEEVRQAGWTHTFSVGAHTLDLRDADDKANWHLLLTKTTGMRMAGFGFAPVRIRTASNTQITVTADEAFAAMNAFLSWGEGLLSRKWDLDDAIHAATDATELAAIDVSAGWPT
jgi:hypothetical protein